MTEEDESKLALLFIVFVLGMFVGRRMQVERVIYIKQ